MMDLRWEIWVGLLLGLVSLFFGIGIRLGHLRAWTRLYFVRGLPAMWRNGSLALIPIGLFFTASMLLGIVEAVNPSPSRAWLPIIALLLVVTIGSIPLMVWATLRPPEWLKPRWMRESSVASSPERTGSRARGN